ncbi:MAG: bifunctional folylpolyglutamate synthase/dihydrofolate synthase [Acidobacteriota bacterium]
MNYREAIAYLESLEPHRIRPGLERIRSLLARLGDPHLDLPCVLVGGTNGKGSLVACLASILREAGIRAGIYTSPHLVRFEERIAAGDEQISADEVAGLTARVRSAIEAGGGEPDTPTYFEATTALAFLHFSRRRVALAVLEVGMGGRFDATNVARPIACAITPIAVDHTQWLGDSLDAIAGQKAGILRTGVPAVVGRQSPAALEAIRAEAERVGAPLAFTSDCEVRPAGGRDRFPDPPVVALASPSQRFEELRIALRGDHQAENAAGAVLLAERLAAAGFPSIDRRAIARGLARASWPGRLELLPGRPDLLLDGAHNAAACETLAAYLREHQAGRPISLVFAAMKDKPIDAMLDILCPLASDVVVTSLPVSRGAPPADLLERARRRHGRACRADRVEEALQTARRAAAGRGLCVASGSLYLVGEIKRLGL